MANIVRRDERETAPTGLGWDPFRVMREMMNFEPFRMFGDLAAPRFMGRTFVPEFEVKERPDAFVIRADVPGLEERDLDINVAGQQLTISGERRAEERSEGEQWYTVERSYGTFSRSFVLPEGVDLDTIDAELKQGVLTLTLPKKAEHKPRKVSVRNVVDKVKGALGGKDRDDKPPAS
jgi:HSP20 family protein